MCAEFTSPLPCVTLALGNGNGNYLQNGGVTRGRGGGGGRGAVLGVCAGTALWGWEGDGGIGILIPMRTRKGVWNQPWLLSPVFCGTGVIWKCGMLWRLCLGEEEEEEGCSHRPAGTGFLSSVAFPATDFPWDELGNQELPAPPRAVVGKSQWGEGGSRSAH